MVVLSSMVDKGKGTQPLSPPLPPLPPMVELKTFIEMGGEEKEKSGVILNNIRNQKRNKRLEEQCIFPTHIPSTAHCDITPMLSLISNHINENHINENMMNQNNNTHRTALNDMKKVASLCASYKNIVLQNQNEFQYKRAVYINNKQKEASRSDMLNEEVESEVAVSNNQLPPRPEVTQYTDLTPMENQMMARIHDANYNLCLAKATCPDRTDKLLSCWKQSDPQVVNYAQENGIEGMICMEERNAVERCVGLSVQRVMKDIIL